MTAKIYSLECLVEFVAVAESGSFTAAARQLGVSVSHVSRQVAALEARLNAQLFARTTRKMRLTDAGRRLFDACQPLVQELLDVQENALDAQEAIAGDIKISLAGKFAEQQLAPLLTQFAVLHPGIRLELDVSARNVDLVGEGFHLAVRMGPLESSNALLATRLVDVSMVLLATQQLLDSLPVMRCPADIPSNMCLCLAGRSWEFVLGRDRVKIIPTGRISSNSGAVLLKAGAAGLGIVNVPAYYVTDAHERNGLVRLFPEWASAERSTFYLVFPAARHMPLRIRRLIDYLREQAAVIDFNSITDPSP